MANKTDPKNPVIELFTKFLCNSDSERKKLTNAIDFWDTIPKYSISRRKMEELRDATGKLDVAHFDFHYRGREYKITIYPCRIEDENGVYMEYYPSAQEELVEEALRKIATEDRAGFYEEEKSCSGVVFSIYKIQRELERMGHQRRTPEIIKSLFILSGSLIQIACSDDKNDAFTRSTFISNLTAVSREKLQEDPGAQWVTHFHPLVTQAMCEIKYRQHSYQHLMSYKSQLTRWMHRLLIEKYNFASMIKPFVLHYQTVKRDSNLLNCTRERQNVRFLDECLQELVDNGILMRVEKNAVLGQRGKMEDVIYTLSPSGQFVRDIKASNLRVTTATDEVAKKRKAPATLQAKKQTSLF